MNVIPLDIEIKRSEILMKWSNGSRNVHANEQDRWTVGNVNAEHDQRFETFEKSRSKSKDQLISTFKL